MKYWSGSIQYTETNAVHPVYNSSSVWREALLWWFGNELSDWVGRVVDQQVQSDASSSESVNNVEVHHIFSSDSFIYCVRDNIVYVVVA